MALLASPANARRLLLLQRVCKLELAAEIAALADQDRLDDGAFDSLVCPCDPAKYAISQFLLDCDLRGTVLPAYHPEMNPLALLNVVRIAAPEQTVIVTARRKLWSKASIALAWPVKLVYSASSLEDFDRHSVVIHDADRWTSFTQLRNLARDYPRFMVYDDGALDRLVPWVTWARMLFPAMPHPIFPRMMAPAPAGWDDLPITTFAPFYNVCIFPHLITAPSILAALQDDYLVERVKHHSLVSML